MSIDRFRELCEAFGADPARWPETGRALHARHAATPEGAKLLAEAARLDRFLDDLEPRAADPLRAARIVQAVQAPARRRRRLALASGAWAASALLGFLLGFNQPGSDEDEAELSQLLLGSTVLEDYL